MHNRCDMNIEEIIKVIPHRYPFLLIDRIETLNHGKDITGIKNVTMNEPYFQGHFPSNPVMPGVLIIEAMAQAGVVLILSMEEFKDKTAYLASIEKARFYKKVHPGDTLVLKVEIINKRGKIIKIIGQADIMGVRCAVAEIVCAVE